MEKYPLGILNVAEAILKLESSPLTASPQSILTSLKAFEKLQNSLTTLIGHAGFYSLLSRALSVAQEEEPRLSQMKIAPKGLLEISEDATPLDDLNGCGKVLIIHFLGLLGTFIGEDLTISILKGIWPSDSIKSSPTNKES